MSAYDYLTLIGQYDSEIENYYTFTDKVKALIIEILNEKQQNVHSVTARVKDRESFYKKIIEPSINYNELSDITDISGVRVVTYFEDEVDIVAEYIEEEFELDEDNTIDKRVVLEPDRFGYASLHLVVSLLPERSRLLEYKRFSKLKVEIQIRSILQHAWAEIEHDLGYKREKAIPSDIRRDFSRLAGHLELADKEFISIRNQLTEYTQEIPEKIGIDPQSISLDKISLTAFVESDPIISEIDTAIVNTNDIVKLDDSHKLDLGFGVELLYRVEVKTISELKNQLLENKEVLIKFSGNIIQGARAERVPIGICIWNLVLLLVSASEDLVEIHNFLDESNIGQQLSRREIS